MTESKLIPRTTRPSVRTHALVLVASALLASVAGAQVPDTATRNPPESASDPHARSVTPLVTIGGPVEDRLRLRQLFGEASTDGFLIRSPSALTPRLGGEGDGLRWRWIAPEVEIIVNTQIPFSMNDGVLWAGRGWNTRLMAGVRAGYGPLSLVLAPQLYRSGNRGFQIIHSEAPGRSTFSSPWHVNDQSADLPLRSGNQPYGGWDLGQSALWVDAGPVAVGASAENQWWGPGIRNAIVMSNNAPGIPHLFLRTAAPLRTVLGEFEAKWMTGGLTESLFYDTIASNDVRSVSGLAATFRPAAEPDLTLGLARVVYAPASGGSAAVGRAFDVFTRWGKPEAGDAEPGDRAFEQILSLFGRWIFPRSGLEVYGEWSRLELPSSLRDFLADPEHTRGYTLGLQWARPLGDSTRTFRLQSEVTYLEQTPAPRDRPFPSYYVSGTVPQGYTHRGQVVGAAIGPGSSSQWIAADYLAPAWSLGLVGGRIRWENDIFYRRPTGISLLAHDVTMFGGVRASGRFGWGEVTAELIRGRRYNYLFQNKLFFFGDEGATDVRSTSFRLRFTPTM